MPLYLSDCITTALQCMTGRSCGHRQHHQDFDELSFLQRTQVLQQQQTTYIERKYYTGSLGNVVSCKVIDLCRAESLHFFSDIIDTLFFIFIFSLSPQQQKPTGTPQNFYSDLSQEQFTRGSYFLISIARIYYLYYFQDGRL